MDIKPLFRALALDSGRSTSTPPPRRETSVGTTNSGPAGRRADQPDTGDMVAVHQMFRTELRTLGGLVATAEVGDRVRADRLAAHLTLVVDFLANHHEGEDDILWPLLERKGAVDTDLLGLMTVHHAELDRLIGEVRHRSVGWARTADQQSRDLLALQLRQLGEILGVHLDAEERFVLPLVREHLTAHEWSRIAAHGAAGTPHRPSAALILLGVILEDAGPAERASFWATLPAAVRLLWPVVGRRYWYRRRVDLRALPV